MEEQKDSVPQDEKNTETEERKKNSELDDDISSLEWIWS